MTQRTDSAPATSAPTKSDTTTTCPKCGGVMRIMMVEPLHDEPKMMQHTFTCGSCEETARFKFEKKKPA